MRRLAFSISLLVGLVMGEELADAPVAMAAQGHAVLVGTVIDGSTEEPLADAAITVTSPALQGVQTVVTDETGSYRVPNLPPGEYEVSVVLDEYKAYSKSEVKLSADATIRLNISLTPTKLRAKEVVVVGEAPTVDVGSSTTGRHIDRDFIEHVPVVRPSARGAQSRSFESLADTVPGATSDAFGTSINGTTSPENQFVIDGVSVNDPAYGILGTPLSIEFIEEVGIITGGYMPEYGRATGGVYDVVTESGSNEFHGSLFTYVTPGIFEGERTAVRSAGQTIGLDVELININDFGFDFGGPIVRDKLWFYAGFDAAFTRYRLTRRLFRIDPSSLQPGLGIDAYDVNQEIPGTARSFDATEKSYQYIGKLTYAINQDHTIAITDYGAPTFSGGDGEFGIDQQADVPENDILDMIGAPTGIQHRYVALSNDLGLKYSGAFDNKNWLLDIAFGWHHQESGTLPQDGSNLGDINGDAGNARVSFQRAIDAEGNPFPHGITDFEDLPDNSACRPPAGATINTLCPTYTYQYGGPDFINEAVLNRYQLRGVLTRLIPWAGHHVVKGGVDFEVMTYDNSKAYSGGRRFEEAVDGSYYIDGREFGFLEGPDRPVYNDPQLSQSLSVTAGAFIQDSWAIMDVVTLNAGVRVDGQYLFGDDGHLAMALANEWSPRVGAIFDPTQQGHSKIFANYAIYYESVPLDLVDRLLPGERQILSLHDPATCDPRDRTQQRGACLEDSNRFPITTPADPNQLWVVTGGDSAPVDPDLAPQSSSEFVVGGEYEVIPRGVIGVSYTRRWMNNVIEDMSRDEGQTYFIGNPGQGIASDFPEAERNYDAMDVYIEKKFDGTDLVHWLAAGSYTLSTLRGNWAGLFRPETAQLDPNSNSDFDIISLLPNREGPLPGDSTHKFKLFGAVEFTPGKFIGDLGLAFNSESGQPTNYFGSHALYGSGEVYVLPRGSGDRLPWVHRLDGHVGLGARLSNDSTIVVTMDVFNLLNFQEITGIDENYTFAPVLPVVGGNKNDLSRVTHPDGTALDPAEVNPNFGNASGYQSPRQFRFGVKATF